VSERRLESLVDELHRAAADGVVSDADLLARFVQSRDPAAFELVIWRHGAMVQAVCRRVLSRSNDVDDAFQATFLVLLLKARSIRRRESLAGWLHRVALRVAQRCRRASFNRLRREQAVAHVEALPPARTDEIDLGPLLHAEIDRLPERLRGPFVLCVLEGKTNEEAARLLGVPHGTVLSRLSRARERLRHRLIQRGVTAATIATAIAAAVEPVSASVVDAAVREVLNDITGTAAAGPAAALAQGVIHAMFVRNLTTAAAGVLAASLVLGLGVASTPRFLTPARAQDKPEVAEQPRPTEAPKKPNSPMPEPPANQSPLEVLLPKKPLKPIHQDELRLMGVWKVTQVMVDGEHRDPEDMNVCFGPFGTMLIADDPVKPAKPMTFKLEPDAKTIELTVNGKTQSGIYLFAEDELQLCLGLKGEKPGDFAADKGSNKVLFNLRYLNACDTKWADALFVKGRSHNFGALQGGERATYKFVVKNIYDRPVALVAEPSVRPDGLLGGGAMGAGAAGPGGPPAAPGGGGFGPGGGSPMGGGAGVPMGPGGFAPGGVGGGGGPVNLWVFVPSPPMQWLQPGEETTIEVIAVAPFGNPPKVAVDLTFHVRGMVRPRTFVMRGGRAGGGANPFGGMGGPSMPGREPVIEVGQSAVELVLTAEGKAK
jgi:RNA polymerase sigma factor (sigma-70 family)